MVPTINAEAFPTIIFWYKPSYSKYSKLHYLVQGRLNQIRSLANENYYIDWTAAKINTYIYLPRKNKIYGDNIHVFICTLIYALQSVSISTLAFIVGSRSACTNDLFEIILPIPIPFLNKKSLVW